jgi:hypothetical protein
VLPPPSSPTTMERDEGGRGQPGEEEKKRHSPGNITTNSWERGGDAPRRRWHNPPARSARPFRYCTGFARQKNKSLHRHFATAATATAASTLGAGLGVESPCPAGTLARTAGANRGGDDAGVRVECSVPPSDTLLHWLAKRKKPRNSARQRKALTTHSDGRGVHKRPSVVGKRLPCLARARGSVMGHALCAVGHAVSVYTGTRLADLTRPPPAPILPKNPPVTVPGQLTDRPDAPRARMARRVVRLPGSKDQVRVA